MVIYYENRYGDNLKEVIDKLKVIDRITDEYECLSYDLEFESHLKDIFNTYDKIYHELGFNT